MRNTTLLGCIFCETVCRYFTTVPSTLIRNYLSEHFLHGFFSPPILIEDSFPKATLTKSFSTRKEERSTKTHVGIMKNTAWQPSMFSSRRWCIRESRNTWWRAPLQLCPNHSPFSVTVTTSRNRLIKYANECWYGVNFQWGHPKKQMSLWKKWCLDWRLSGLTTYTFKVFHKLNSFWNTLKTHLLTLSLCSYDFKECPVFTLTHSVWRNDTIQQDTPCISRWTDTVKHYQLPTNTTKNSDD